MIIEMTDPKGIVLKTAQKFCNDDVTVVPTLQTVTVTRNGTTTVDPGYVGIKKVEVNVAPNLQSKNISVSDFGQVDIYPDNGYDGLSHVTVLVNESPDLEPTVPEYNGEYYILR
jgi:hypothetical protein